MDDDIELLKQMIQESKSIVFFGGAGVSTESGIPDFRGVDGLYSQKFEYPPEYMLSHTCFKRHTKEFFDFYRAKMLVTNVSPNAAHYRLAELERAGKLTAVVTQNIDGLHQAAGSKTVYELHGSIHRNHCVACGRAFSAQDVQATTGIPRCACGGIIKPDVVLYEEGLPSEAWYGAVSSIGECDLLIVAGTSLSVYPASGLVDYCSGRRVLINLQPTPRDKDCDLVLRRKVGEVMKLI